MGTMRTQDEVVQLIQDGKILVIAAEEKMLEQLPEGNWIGGTIPYFMSDQGGIVSQDQYYVNALPEYISKIEIKTYNKDSVKHVYEDSFDQGFSVVMIPSGSPIHLEFALKARSFDGFLKVPLIGWITGSHLDNLGKVAPKVFFGPKKRAYEQDGVVLHCALPEGKMADIDIINGFVPDTDSPEIQFPTDGFSARECTVDGKTMNFAQYVESQGIDIKLPLVADHNGTMINTSFQKVEGDQVDFYAPIFKGISYHVAKPVGDYIQDFTSRLNRIEGQDSIFFSCNCILNFLYADLEGKETGGITGPITFGEIAYQLLNQTLVYLKII